MKSLKLGGILALAVWLSALSATAGRAQTPAVTQADIQRLQDVIYDASRDVAQAGSRDGALAADLQSDLDDARDEAIYLKVKLRKREPIARGEYAELRDRIDGIRARARGVLARRSDAPPPSAAYPPPPPRPSDPGPAYEPPPRQVPRAANPTEIPVGAEFDVRLQTPLGSETAQVEDRFEATTMVDLMNGDRVLVPAGSLMRGVVSSVVKAGRIERKGSLTVAFDRVTINGRAYPIRATVVQALESEGVRGEAGKIGTGAGVGAIIGGILGGFKGALAGVLIGGGGTMAATEGKDVVLQPGTVLRVRLDSALDVR